MPPLDTISFKSVLADAAENLADAFCSGKTNEETKSFQVPESTDEFVLFLEKCMTKCPLAAAVIENIDHRLALNGMNNAEVRLRWITLNLKSCPNDSKVHKEAVEFLKLYGRYVSQPRKVITHVWNHRSAE